MIPLQVRNSLRLKIVMETVVVMNLASNRKTTVLVDTVDIVDSAGEISKHLLDGRKDT